MCGILWTRDGNVNMENCLKAIKRRGPDQQAQKFIGSTLVAGAVLQLRGVGHQPMEDDVGNVLVWNGQVFGGLEVNENENDTKVILHGLANCESDLEMMRFMQKVKGPWAMVFVKKGVVYYGHDRMGRRSLLRSLDGSLVVSCHLEQIDMEEVGNDGLYKVDGKETVLLPWCDVEADDVFHGEEGHSKLIRDDKWKLNSNFKLNGFCSEKIGMASMGLYAKLRMAMKRRIENIPKRNDTNCGVFFSGGLDSVVIAAMADEFVPKDEPIELYNVCFDEKTNFGSPDRLAAETSLLELKDLYSHREWRFVEINIPYEQVKLNASRIRKLIQPCNSMMDFNIGTAFWFLAKGMGNMDPTHQHIVKTSTETLTSYETPNEQHSIQFKHVGVKNSTKCGMHQCKRRNNAKCRFKVCGACCKSLHALAAECISNPKLIETHFGKHYEVSDIQKYIDTKMLFCKVHKYHHPKYYTISNISPTKLKAISNQHPYECKSRVVLLGIGADEQLGGYSRHRKAFLKGGLENVSKELNLDCERIWKRNLGRDDRCIADHGREARYPFLDENVMQYIKSLEIDQILDFNHPNGDKLILRHIAFQLGLIQSTQLPKRAIQFGSRIAKCTDNSSNAKGTDSID